MSIHDEGLVWAGVEQRLVGVESLIPDPPPWRAPTESQRAGRAVIRLGPALRAERDSDGTRRRRGRLVWGLVVLGALLLAVAGAIVSGALRFDPRPNLSTGPLGPIGVLRGSDSAGNAALLPDGRVLIMTGTWVGIGGAASVPQVWDPATGELTMLGPTVQARVNPTATLLLDGRVLVVGGFGGPFAYPSSAIATAEVWDPQSGSFTAAGSMAQPRVGHTATLLLDGRVLIVGGLGPGSDGAAVEIWDPSTGEFMAAGRLRMGRTGHAAILEPGGRVLILGGTTTDERGGGIAEVWDPATVRVQGAWRLLDFATDPVDVALARRLDGRVQVLLNQAGPGWHLEAIEWDMPMPLLNRVGSGKLEDARYGLAAVPTLDGRVVVFGGIESPTDATTAVDIWDPALASFTAARPYPRPIAGRSLTLLPDGRILVIGPPELGGTSSIVDVYHVEERP